MGPNPTSSAAAAERRCVLQVLPALETGGVERGAVDVAAALAAAGWRALVASSGGALVREVERAGAEHVTLPLARKSPLAVRANAHLLAGLIEARGVDIVHARSRAPAWSALHAARRTGRPFVTTFHAPYNFNNPLKRWVLSRRVLWKVLSWSASKRASLARCSSRVSRLAESRERRANTVLPLITTANMTAKAMPSCEAMRARG